MTNSNSVVREYGLATPKENKSNDIGKPMGATSKKSFEAPHVRNTKFSYGFRELIIKNIVGTYKENICWNTWDRIPDSQKAQIWWDGFLLLKKSLYKHFGSQTNYLNWWAKKSGYKNLTEWKYENARIRGFNKYSDYLNYLYRKKGFKDKAQHQRWRRFLKRQRLLSKLTRKEIKHLFRQNELKREARKLLGEGK